MTRKLIYKIKKMFIDESFVKEFDDYNTMMELLFKINEHEDNGYNDILQQIDKVIEKYSIKSVIIVKIIDTVARTNLKLLRQYIELFDKIVQKYHIEVEQQLFMQDDNYFYAAISKKYNKNWDIGTKFKNLNYQQILQVYPKDKKLMMIMNDEMDKIIQLIDSIPSNSQTNLLNYCAKYGSIYCFKFLITKNVVPDENCLIEACQGGNLEIYHIIFQNIENKLNEEQKLELFQKCIERSINCHRSELVDHFAVHMSLDYSWHACSESYNMKYFLEKLSNIEDINIHDDYECTALQESIKFGSYRLVEKIINIPGIDVNHKNNINETALMEAAKNDAVEIIKLLIDKKAYLDTKNDYGQTALMICAINNSLNSAKALIEAKACHYLKDDENKIALDYAKEYGYDEMIRFLEQFK